MPPQSAYHVGGVPSSAGWLSRRREDAVLWCQGRSWAWRAPVLLYVAYAGIRHLTDSSYSSIFSGINFGVHELGHLVFAWFGHFLAVAGGTMAELILPVAAAALLLAHRDYFGVAVTGAWLSMAFADVAIYMADAQERSLTLLGFGPDPEHDWYYLLSTVGLLEQDRELAQLTRLISFITLTVSVGLGTWLCRRMSHGRSARPA